MKWNGQYLVYSTLICSLRCTLKQLKDVVRPHARLESELAKFPVHLTKLFFITIVVQSAMWGTVYLFDSLP